jgi:hypothetical protein
MCQTAASLATVALALALVTGNVYAQASKTGPTNATPKMGTQAGTVVSASATELVIRNAKGEKVTMDVARNVVYVNAKPVKLADIKEEKWATVRGIINEPAKTVDAESIALAETKPENAEWTVDATKKIAVGYLKVAADKGVLRAEGEKYEVEVRDGRTRILLTTSASSDAVKPGVYVLATGGITSGRKTAKWIAVLPGPERPQTPPAPAPEKAGGEKN